MDFNIFLSANTWVTMLILIFLELVLGIDNLVFIAITTARLPQGKRHIGRRLGLLGALAMRIVFLCFAAFIAHIQTTLFTLPLPHEPFFDPAISGKDLLLLVGGAYLVWKGVDELFKKVTLKEERAEYAVEQGQRPPTHKQERAAARASHQIGLGRAIGTIMVMDVVFSIDSVITAVGMSGQLIVMIIAVILAVLIMIIFADPISEFINRNPEITLLALAFITLVGIKLVSESLGIEACVAGSDVQVVDVGLYSAMAVSLIVTVLQMLYRRRQQAFSATHPLKQEEEDADAAALPQD
ncbi:MAG: TerC family protein [Coriobacteriales bacterium]|jgi:predicted tellurium resistance membrane protein TerC|nr:TerC family protein [Coriobacteriales bacterium]